MLVQHMCSKWMPGFHVIFSHAQICAAATMTKIQNFHHPEVLPCANPLQANSPPSPFPGQ